MGSRREGIRLEEGKEIRRYLYFSYPLLTSYIINTFSLPPLSSSLLFSPPFLLFQKSPMRVVVVPRIPTAKPKATNVIAAPPLTLLIGDFDGNLLSNLLSLKNQ